MQGRGIIVSAVFAPLTGVTGQIYTDVGGESCCAGLDILNTSWTLYSTVQCSVENFKVHNIVMFVGHCAVHLRYEHCSVTVTVRCDSVQPKILSQMQEWELTSHNIHCLIGLLLTQVLSTKKHIQGGITQWTFRINRPSWSKMSFLRQSSSKRPQQPYKKRFVEETKTIFRAHYIETISFVWSA